MLDLTLLNSTTGLVDGTNPRPVINIPLTGNLDGGGIGVGSFKRASSAYYFDNTNVMQHSPYNLNTYSWRIASFSTISDQTMTLNLPNLSGVTNSAYSVEGAANPNANHSYNTVTGLSPATQYTLSFYHRGVVMTGTQVISRVYDQTNSAWITGENNYVASVVQDTWVRETTTFTTPAGCTSVRLYAIRLIAVGAIYGITGVQLVEGSEALDLVDTDGAANGAPRFTKNGLLIEPAGTNEITQSRDLTGWSADGSPTVTRDQVGIDGVANTADLVIDDSAIESQAPRRYVSSIPDDSNTHCVSAFFKKDNDVSRFPSLEGRVYDGTTARDTYAMLNTATGAVNVTLDDGSDDTAYVEDYGDWWRLCLTVTNNSSGNDKFRIRIFPAKGTVWGVNDATATGSVIVDQAQLELNQSYASSPIVTTTEAVTRATEAGEADVSGAQWDLNSTLTDMLEETLGADLVTNGDFAADTDWVKWTGWTIAAGVASCDGTQVATSQLYQTNVVGTDTTVLYKITLDLTVSAGNWQVYLGDAGWNVSEAYSHSEWHTDQVDGTYTFYLKPPTTGDNVDRFKVVGDADFVGTVDNVVVKAVTNDSRGTMVCDWTPYVAADNDDVAGLASRAIISLNDELADFLYTRALTPFIGSKSDPGISYVTLDWDELVTYRLVLRWGINTLNVRQLGLSFRDGAGSWTHDTLDDYDGAYPIDEALLMLLFKTIGWGQAIKNIKFFNGTPLTDAEIEKL